jgi:hypothetical protein
LKVLSRGVSVPTPKTPPYVEASFGVENGKKILEIRVKVHAAQATVSLKFTARLEPVSMPASFAMNKMHLQDEVLWTADRSRYLWTPATKPLSREIKLPSDLAPFTPCQVVIESECQADHLEEQRSVQTIYVQLS